MFLSFEFLCALLPRKFAELRDGGGHGFPFSGALIVCKRHSARTNAIDEIGTHLPLIFVFLVCARLAEFNDANSLAVSVQKNYCPRLLLDLHMVVVYQTFADR